MNTEKVCVGAIGGSYGVRGEVRIKSFCATPEDIEAYSPLTDETGARQFHLAIIRAIKNGFVARIVEISSKEDASRYTAHYHQPAHFTGTWAKLVRALSLVEVHQPLHTRYSASKGTESSSRLDRFYVSSPPPPGPSSSTSRPPSVQR